MASKRHREKHFQKHFEAREQGLDHQKLKKRAAELRRAEEEKEAAARRKVRRTDWADLLEGDTSAFDERARRAQSTEAWLARLKADEQQGGGAAGAAPSTPGLREGLVVFVTAGKCHVAPAEGEPVPCDLDADLRRRQRSALAAGDRVLFDPALSRVRSVLPRATVLSRPDPHNPHVERVIAANVDLVLVVAALREPRLSAGLVERVVLAAGRGGAAPVVCVTKLDLARDRAGELAPLAPLAGQGVPVVPCSVLTGEGLADLRGRIAGRTSVLVGHSGVGKSSLLNAVAPDLALAVGRVRAADGKGRHTTTASSLHALPDGTRLIDTPGVREFGLWGMTPAELAGAFPEIARAAEACRFRDCAHDREPDCAVRAAAEEGRLPVERLRSYLRIKGTL